MDKCGIRKLRDKFESMSNCLDEDLVKADAVSTARELGVPLEKVWVWDDPVPTEDELARGVSETKIQKYLEEKKALDAEYHRRSGGLHVKYADQIEELNRRNARSTPQTGDIPAIIPLRETAVEYGMTCPGCGREITFSVGENRWGPQGGIGETWTCHCGWILQGKLGMEPVVGVELGDDVLKDKLVEKLITALKTSPRGVSIRKLSELSEISRDKTTKLVEDLVEEETIIKTSKNRLVMSP